MPAQGCKLLLQRFDQADPQAPLSRQRAALLSQNSSKGVSPPLRAVRSSTLALLRLAGAMSGINVQALHVAMLALGRAEQLGKGVDVGSSPGAPAGTSSADSSRTC